MDGHGQSHGPVVPAISSNSANAGEAGKGDQPRGTRTAKQSIVVSSHDSGQNNRQFAANDAVSVTNCTLTPI